MAGPRESRVHIAAIALALWIAALVGGSAAQEPIPPGQVAARPAANTLRLTFEGALAQAMAQNKALTLARMNIDSKQLAATAATKDYLPKVIGSVTYFHFSDPLGTVLTTRGGNTVSATVLNQNTALSTAMVAQPITKLIAVHANVQVTRADEQIARAQADSATKQILAGVSQAYYGLLGAQRIGAALGLQETVLAQVATRNPTPDARIQWIELRQAIAGTQGQIGQLTDQLNDLFGLPAGTLLELVDPMPPHPPIDSADGAVQLALTSNPDVREAELTIVKAEAALKLAQMAYLPDVNLVSGYANQTGASYIQPNIGYLGLTANYTFWEWGKKRDLSSQREIDLRMAHQSLHLARDKVQLEARQAYGSFAQALTTYQLAGEMAQARRDAEQTAQDRPTALAAKAATAGAQLEQMKAEIAYRVAHAQLMAAIGGQCFQR